jgi:hypothetical protein
MALTAYQPDPACRSTRQTFFIGHAAFGEIWLYENKSSGESPSMC